MCYNINSIILIFWLNCFPERRFHKPSTSTNFISTLKKANHKVWLPLWPKFLFICLVELWSIVSTFSSSCCLSSHPPLYIVVQNGEEIVISKSATISIISDWIVHNGMYFSKYWQGWFSLSDGHIITIAENIGRRKLGIGYYGYFYLLLYTIKRLRGKLSFFCEFLLTAIFYHWKFSYFVIRTIKYSVVGKRQKFSLHNEHCW